MIPDLPSFVKPLREKRQIFLWEGRTVGGVRWVGAVGVSRWIRSVPPHPAKTIFTENCFRHLPLHRGRLWRFPDVPAAKKAACFRQATNQLRFLCVLALSGRIRSLPMNRRRGYACGMAAGLLPAGCARFVHRGTSGDGTSQPAFRRNACIPLRRGRWFFAFP